MNFQITKEIFLENLFSSSHFTTTKFASLSLLQGVLVKGEEKHLHFYSTNLNSFFHSSIPVKNEEKFECVIEPKKIIEFVNLLSAGDISLEISEKNITVSQKKTKGTFPLINKEDFPMPPEIKEKEKKLNISFLTNNLPLILFSSSTDTTRPQLTGVNIVSQKEDLVMVSTDGFRLSFLKMKNDMKLPSMLIPGQFLKEVLYFLKEEKEVDFSYSEAEKTVVFRSGGKEFFSRLVEGDFPPFEKVIPSEVKTKITIEREEFLRNIKLVSVFARDYSNIIICDFQKEGLHIKPKIEGDGGNDIFQDIEIEGEGQKIAFNFKFILDFLNNISYKNITIEVLRPDAPVVFKTEENKDFLHLIMPVRVQE